jgi:hypothetical protein
LLLVAVGRAQDVFPREFKLLKKNLGFTFEESQQFLFSERKIACKKKLQKNGRISNFSPFYLQNGKFTNITKVQSVKVMGK